MHDVKRKPWYPKIDRTAWKPPFRRFDPPTPTLAPGRPFALGFTLGAVLRKTINHFLPFQRSLLSATGKEPLPKDINLLSLSHHSALFFLSAALAGGFFTAGAIFLRQHSCGYTAAIAGCFWCLPCRRLAVFPSITFRRSRSRRSG